MGFSTPAALAATIIATVPLTTEAAEAQSTRQPTEQVVEISGENLMYTCTVPIMTVGRLKGYANSLGESLGRAINVTTEELASANTRASGRLDLGKKTLKDRTFVIVKDLEALQNQMDNMISNLSTDAPASEFVAGSAKQAQLAEWGGKLKSNKDKLDGISQELPLLTARVRVTDENIRLEDVRYAFEVWGENSGISCPDTVETYVAINRTFPSASKESGTIPVRRSDAEGVGSLGLKTEPAIINREQPTSPLWAFVDEVNGLKNQASNLLGEATGVITLIDKTTLPQ